MIPVQLSVGVTGHCRFALSVPVGERQPRGAAADLIITQVRSPGHEVKPGNAFFCGLGPAGGAPDGRHGGCPHKLFECVDKHGRGERTWYLCTWLRAVIPPLLSDLAASASEISLAGGWAHIDTGSFSAAPPEVTTGGWGQPSVCRLRGDCGLPVGRRYCRRAIRDARLQWGRGARPRRPDRFQRTHRC